jgi:hypothetical protein
MVGSIHSLGSVGHIEDIAVAKDQQGKKLGLRIIQALDFMASKVGCYKVCSVLVPQRLEIDQECRVYWIAPRSTRDSTISVGTRGRA